VLVQTSARYSIHVCIGVLGGAVASYYRLHKCKRNQAHANVLLVVDVGLSLLEIPATEEPEVLEVVAT
jgi:hypothetical protein